MSLFVKIWMADRRGAPKKNGLCLLRLQKDFDEFGDLEGVSLLFPDPNNLQIFIIRVRPDHGIWQGGVFDFQFTIPDEYPFQRPGVKCLTRIWHPNIEETGAVCLNILRDNYTPVMSIAHLAVGLQFLFTEPNPLSPLNQEASEHFERDLNGFTLKARQYMTMYCPKEKLEEKSD